jgi:hypothetical protein
MCVTIITTFSQECAKSRVLKFLENGFREEAIREYVSHGGEIYRRVKEPGVSTVQRTRCHKFCIDIRVAMEYNALSRVRPGRGLVMPERFMGRMDGLRRNSDFGVEECIMD